jgi:adenosine deaminase
VWELVRKEAARVGQQLGVGVGFIAGAERWLPPSDSVVTAKLVVQLMTLRTAADGAPLAPIVGFGLQGPEEGFPPEQFEEAFTIARAAGLLSVPHAGEHCGPESVLGALDSLGARRLAHGVRAVEDSALVARLAAERVCCDTCPTSNVMLRVVPSITAHPLPSLVAAGVPCTVSADDPLLFRGVGLLHEYETLRAQLRMTDAQLAHLARTSFAFSGCPDAAVTAAGVAGVDAWLAAEA